jgi:hypothetical protein
MHGQLEANNGQTYVVDEVGEWIAQAARDSHRQAAVGYLMEASTRHHGQIAPPQSIARQYKPANNPRVGIIAMSTPERMLAVMNGEHAASGSAGAG